VIAEKYSTLRFRFAASAWLLGIGTLLYPLTRAVGLLRGR
jgi:hypothetical protein